MTPLTHLVLAYAFIWAALAVYLVLLGRRIARVSRDVEELRRRAARPGSESR